MEKKKKRLNLCEKLAGCPEGTKLWSPLFGECEFVKINNRIVVNSFNLMGYTSFDRYGHYFDSSEECLIFPSRENRDWDNWECPKPKVEHFDPKTLQPFDKVLVRDNGDAYWSCDFFSRLKKEVNYPVVAFVDLWKCCVPYNEDTKHLLGTRDEAPEFYRWWEDK